MSAFNGSGTFVISGTGLPYVTATTISSTVANQLNTDLATGLSTTVTKDGQTTPTANLPMGTFKHTGAGNATATGQYLVYGQGSGSLGTLTLTGALTYGSVTLSNAVTGTGSMVLSAGPTLTGTLAAAAATFSGTITPSSTNGIVGTTTNDNANAGSVGEYIESEVLVGSAVGLTTGTAANITSISLTAGDWDVSGSIFYTGGGTSTFAVGWCSSTSATQPTFPNKGGLFNFNAASVGSTFGQCLGPRRFSISGPTTVYLSTLLGISGGSISAYGFIRARRMR